MSKTKALWRHLLLAVAGVLLTAPLITSAELVELKPTRQIEDKKFELIETGLSPWPRTEGNGYWPNFYGFWLNNTQLVMSVLQDVPNAFANRLERIMLIDTATGASRVLVEQGSLWCHSRKFNVMVYLPYERAHYYKDNPGKNIGDDDLHFVRLDKEGRLNELDGPAPINRSCVPPNKVVKEPRASQSLQEGDGYIDMSARDDKETLTLGTAKLVRPGQPPLELGLPNASVQYPIYLPYYDKYLMSASDYGKGGGTAMRYAGAFWKFPYNFSPYWIVSREGEVEAVPYPEIISEYGMAGFQYLWPTPHGLLINDPSVVRPGKGLLLLQGDRLLRLWGGPLSLNFFKTNYGRAENSYVLNISPDACRVVFMHARKFPLPREKNPAPIPLSILNICKAL